MPAAIFCSSIIAIKLIGHQLGCHNTSGVQCIAERNTNQPCQRIEYIAKNLLEAQAKQRGKQGINGADQAIKPISIARIIIATLKPARIYSSSISKKLCDSWSSSLISLRYPDASG